jgi:plastocyanin
VTRFVVAAAIAALVVPAPAAAATRLVATVGPSATITLTKAGRKVTTVPPGAYTITVRDRSRFHNFALTGPRLRRLTTVSFTGTRTWSVTLRRGKHTYVCTPHASFMRGTFNVR